MKKIIALLAIATICSAASAFTFISNGVLMGTVCRNGVFFTPYPPQMAQPVGTSCPIRDNYGMIVMYGVVTNE